MRTPLSGTTERADEGSVAHHAVLRRPLEEHQGADLDGTGAGSRRRQPGTGSPLLADREGDSFAAGAGRLGKKCHPAPLKRSIFGVPGDERSVAQEPRLHGVVRGGLAR